MTALTIARLREVIKSPNYYECRYKYFCLILRDITFKNKDDTVLWQRLIKKITWYRFKKELVKKQDPQLKFSFTEDNNTNKKSIEKKISNIIENLGKISSHSTNTFIPVKL